MVVRELVTRLGFDADTGAAKKYDKTLAGVRQTARRAAVAVGAIGAAATGLVWQFTQASSQTLAWSNRLGVTTRELQRLQFAAEKYQITNEALTDGLKELSLRTDEFIKEGKGQGVEAFKELELGAKELNAVSNDTGALFRLVQSRIRDIDNAAARQRIADELFGGQAGEQFSEFLGISADELDRLASLADQTGAVVPRATLERAREFSREFSTLTSIIGGFGKTLAASMLPAFRSFVEATKEWFLANREIIQQKMRRIVDGIGFSLRMVSAIVWTFVRAVDEAAEAAGGWERMINLAVSALIALTGMRLLKWFGGLTRAIWAAEGAAMALRGALSLIMRFFLFGWLVLAINDIWNWVNANDSAIGEVLGSWNDFKKSWNLLWDDINNKPQRVLGALGALGKTAAENFMRRYIKALPGGSTILQSSDYLSGLFSRSESDVSRDMQSQAALNNRGAVVSARTEVTLPVQPGTSEEQRRQIEQGAILTFEQHWDRMIRQAMSDVQPVE